MALLLQYSTVVRVENASLKNEVASLETQLAAALEMVHSLLAQRSEESAVRVATTVSDLAKLRRQREVFEARAAVSGRAHDSLAEAKAHAARVDREQAHMEAQIKAGVRPPVP